MQVDGTWCGQCGGALHHGCVAEGQPCPGCGVEWRRPQLAFHFSEKCPVCARPNRPARETCGHCGSITHWETVGLYRERRSQVNQWGMKQFWLGCSMVVAAACFMIFYFGIASITVALFAVPAGLLKMRAGLRGMGFR